MYVFVRVLKPEQYWVSEMLNYSTELLIDTENDYYMMNNNKTEIVDICVV